MNDDGFPFPSPYLELEPQYPDSDDWSACRAAELRKTGELAGVQLLRHGRGRYEMVVVRQDGSIEHAPRLRS